jgi:hypothetical protein
MENKKLKRLIVTLASGDRHNQIHQLTEYSHLCYAEKVNAIYKVRRCTEAESAAPHFAKYKCLEELKEYEQVLFIDADILINPNAPDIFENKPDALYLVEEGSVEPRTGLTNQFAFQNNLNQPSYGGPYYNTGVMLMAGVHHPFHMNEERFRSLKITDGYFEQTGLNYLIDFHGIATKQLDPRFNWMKCFWGPSAPRTSGWFVHYAGFAANNLKELLQLLSDDNKTFFPQQPRSIKRKIAFKIDGGIGDQFAAEPAVRFALENIFHEDDAIIVTHTPEIYEHLGVPVHVTGKAQIPDSEERQVLWSLPVVGHPLWNHLSHNLCNAYDYAAIALLKGPLPARNREGKLHERFDLLRTENQESPLLKSLLEKTGLEVGRLQGSVLIHAGSGWPSKTFPIEFWVKLIDLLQQQTTRDIILIGKTLNDEQGVVGEKPDALHHRTGAINLVDKLSMEELLGLLSIADHLVTNDSAPLHLASAFRNRITCIPTCKRPEFIKPYRKGVYMLERNPKRMQAEGRKYFYDQVSRDPLASDVVTLDKCDPAELKKVLPHYEDIEEWIATHFPNENEADLPF